jgi:RIP metalloprotease RseP
VKSTKFELLEKEEADPSHDLPEDEVEEALKEAKHDDDDLDGKSFKDRLKFFSGGILFNIGFAAVIYFVASFVGQPFLNSNPSQEGDILMIQSINSDQTGFLEEYETFQIDRFEVEDLSESQLCDLGEQFEYGCDDFRSVVNSSDLETLTFVKQEETDEFGNFLQKLDIKFDRSEQPTPFEQSGIPTQAQLISYTVNGVTNEINSIRDYTDMTTQFAQQEVEVKYEYSGETDTATLVPNIADSGSTGVIVGSIDRNQSFNPFRNALNAINQTYFSVETIFVGTVKVLGGLFVTPEESISQVRSVVGVYPEFESIVQQTSLEFALFNILPLISIVLAIMNLLPIPALDGGHIAFALYEKMTGHTVKPKTYIRINTIGFIVIMGLGLLLVFRDIGNLI